MTESVGYRSVSQLLSAIQSMAEQRPFGVTPAHISQERPRRAHS